MKNNFFLLIGIAPNLIVNCLDSLQKLKCKIIVAESKDNLSTYKELLTKYNVIELVTNISKSNEIVEKLNELGVLNELIGVYSFREDGLISAAQICGRLNLKSLPSKVVESTVDKFQTREILRQMEVDEVQYSICNNLDEILKFYDGREKIVMKPRNLKGSIGVKIAKSEEEIIENFTFLQEIVGNEGILVEEYLEGEEIAVEFLVIDKKINFIDVTKKIMFPNSTVERGHICPHPNSEIFFKKYEGWFYSIINALGIDFGPVALEMIINEPNVNLVEIHTRYGGDCLITMAEKVYQNNFVYPIFEYLVTSKTNQLRERQAYGCAMTFYPLLSVGTVNNRVDLSFLDLSDQVLDYELSLCIGTKIGQIESSLDRVGWITIFAENYRFLDEVSNKLETRIKELISYE